MKALLSILVTGADTPIVKSPKSTQPARSPSIEFARSNNYHEDFNNNISLFDLSEHTRSSSPDSLFRNDYGYDNEDGGDESFQSPHFQLGTSPEVEHSLENDSHNNSSSFAQSIMPETEANFATSPAANTPVNSSMSKTT